MARRPVEFVALSKADIEDRVIDYFADRFNRPVTEFDEKTNPKKRFNYSARAWRDLADVFNRMAWMAQLKVRISQHEMSKVSTIGEITNLIWKKVPKLAAVTAAHETPVTQPRVALPVTTPTGGRKKRKPGAVDKDTA